MTADILVLRLDAPMVSFGGPVVDAIGAVDAFPGLSLIAGLIANALGWDHRNDDRLQRLQGRLRIAVRCDRPGEPLVDYQTVDLGQGFMEVGWTTWGRAESRRGGDAREATHIRSRHYRADSVHTVALTLSPAGEDPDVGRLAQALDTPARPLFIGRKCCLPAAPLLAGRVRAASPLEALQRLPRLPRDRTGLPAGERLAACWEAEDGAEPDEAIGRLVPAFDRRDWANQLHLGRRLVWQGSIDPPEAAHGDG